MFFMYTDVLVPTVLHQSSAADCAAVVTILFPTCLATEALGRLRFRAFEECRDPRGCGVGGEEHCVGGKTLLQVFVLLLLLW